MTKISQLHCKRVTLLLTSLNDCNRAGSCWQLIRSATELDLGLVQEENRVGFVNSYKSDLNEDQIRLCYFEMDRDYEFEIYSADGDGISGGVGDLN